jgi:undecaprenyl-diphosphatase
MDTLIILCAKYLIWLVVLMGLAFLFFSMHWRRVALSAAFSMALAYVLARVVGSLWYDPRPFVVDHIQPLIAHAADNGFPSDHMLLGAAIASVVYAHNRAWGIALWVLALIVGAARVLSGVHHWVDLAGSIIVAVVAVAIVEFVLRRIWRERDYSPAVQ